MKKEIIGVLISILLLTTAVPIAESLINSSINATVSRTTLTSIETCVCTKEKLNRPPIIWSPYPLNNSFGNPISFIFSVMMYDPEGDHISWTIQCINGENTIGTNEVNGSKYLVLDGLMYSTKYKVWVNATDPAGSGSYTRVWYVFTTKGSQRPVFGVPTPSNRSINTSLSFNWIIPINDPEGDVFSWTIQCSNGQTTSGTGASNGTKSLSLSGLAYKTTFKVWVNATDPTGSGLYTRRWYTFTTKANQPPAYGTPIPANGSDYNPLNLSWSIAIIDPEGDAFSWTIDCSNGQTASGTGASNGTKSLVLSGLANVTTYKVWVNVTDLTGSGLYTRKWYVFTTKGNHPPVFGSPTPSNGSFDNLWKLSWSIPINDPEGNTFTWTIQCSNGQVNSGTVASNGTKSLSLTGLTYSTTYKVWVNATDPTNSGLYTRKWYTFTTMGIQPPNKPIIYGPANGKIGGSYNYNFFAVDPAEDNVSYRIDWGDGSATTDWMGPYPSGQLIIVSHTFSKIGVSIIRCQAKNSFNELSNWGTLEVTMPVSINLPFHQFIERLFQRFPHAFPLLRQLLE